MPTLMNIEEARQVLLSLTEEFEFDSPFDKSRFFAHLFSPAFIMARLLGIRGPIFLIEADESQAGKGYAAQIQSAIYNDRSCVINQQRGGVGSVEESMNEGLIRGDNFILLDNLTPGNTGTFNSEKICSFTTMNTYTARGFGRKSYLIDPSGFVIQITTNGCSLSKDLMNRCIPVKIRKKHRYQFRIYEDGGDLLHHIIRNQPKYYGAGLSIIMDWWRRGKPRTTEIMHESGFTPWVQIMDAIVQYYLGLPPLLGGYEHIRSRIQSPELQEMRDLSLAARNTEKLDQKLTVTDLLDTAIKNGTRLSCIPSGINISSLDQDKIKGIRMQMGRFFSHCFNNFGNKDMLTIDGFKIERLIEKKQYEGHPAEKDITYYRFTEIEN